MKNEDIKFIVIHCSATRPHLDVDIEDIRKWHTDDLPLGNGWTDVGYHGFIKRDGTYQPGRALGISGAHVKGYNGVSWGICLAGGSKGSTDYTDAQLKTLRSIVEILKDLAPQAKVVGHYELDSRKTCPNVPVKTLLGEE